MAACGGPTLASWYDDGSIYPGHLLSKTGEQKITFAFDRMSNGGIVLDPSHCYQLTISIFTGGGVFTYKGYENGGTADFYVDGYPTKNYWILLEGKGSSTNTCIFQMCCFCRG
jgi:hypothetical protein